MSQKDLRIAIVGAGAAGVITGLRLAQEGFKPVIYERRKEIEDSTNSGAISHDSLNQLYTDTDFESAPHRASRVDGIRVVYPGGGTVTLTKSGYTLHRTAWLRAIAAEYIKAGGELETGRTVSPEELEYDVLIGADGALSGVRKMIGGQVEINRPLECVLRPKDDYQSRWLSYYPNKELSSGYVWTFPLGENVVVGLDTNFGKLAKFLRMQRIKGKVEKRSARLESYNGTKYQEGNVVLIGDAAGQANPFTRGGLTPIIYASRILVDCIKEGKLEEYEPRVCAHPSFSPTFKEASSVWSGLTNQDLEFIGTVSDGLEVPNSGLGEKLARLPKALRRPGLLKKLMLLDKAFHEAHRWSF